MVYLLLACFSNYCKDFTFYIYIVFSLFLIFVLSLLFSQCARGQNVLNFPLLLVYNVHVTTCLLSFYVLYVVKEQLTFLLFCACAVFTLFYIFCCLNLMIIVDNYKYKLKRSLNVDPHL